MLALYQTVVTFLIFAVFLNLLNNLRLLRKPPAEGPLPPDLPMVSVLVPARNEERNIGNCVSSLLAQDYPSKEIIVLDDDSSDQTASIVEAMAAENQGLTLVKGKPLPPGWIGKNYACHQLAQLAHGEWFLFTDADTIHSPCSISASLRGAIQEEADFLSLIPHIVTGSFWEKVLLPVIPFGLLGFWPISLMNSLPYPRVAMALGPFMLVKKEAYLKAGGYEAIHDNIVDDIALAREVKRAGGRIALMDGTDLVSVRFYRNFREIWDGLSKSIFGALDYSLFTAALYIAVGWSLFIYPYFLVFQSVAFREFHFLTFWVPSFQIALAWLMHYKVARRFKLSRLVPFLSFLTIGLTLLMIINSVRCSLIGKGLAWKGRYYNVGVRR